MSVNFREFLPILSGCFVPLWLSILNQEIHKILPNFPRLSGLLRLLKTRVRWHGPPHKTIRVIIKHLIYGTVYYTNIFTNLSLLSIEMYVSSIIYCQNCLVGRDTWLGHLGAASLFCLVQACTSLHKTPQENCRFTDAEHHRYHGGNFDI